MNLEDLSAENITTSEQEPQLWFNGQLVLSHKPKKQKRPITNIASWMEAFSFICLILCSSFPHRWRDLRSYKLLNLQTYRQFSEFCWLDYDRAFTEHSAAEKVTDWSKMHVQLFNYHTASAQVCTRPASSSVVSSQAVKLFAILGRRVIALQLMHVSGARAIIVLLLVLLRSLLVLARRILRSQNVASAINCLCSCCSPTQF